jgi:hypothetical protein
MKPWLKKAERNLAFRNFSASIIAFAALFEHQKKSFTTLPPVVNRKLMWRSVTTTTFTNGDNHEKPGIGGLFQVCGNWRAHDQGA